VKDSLFALGAHAFRAALSQGTSRPVIVCHHGSQGLSAENHLMAEYFASRGYGFV
jgi:dienelactone hydrolase